MRTPRPRERIARPIRPSRERTAGYERTPAAQFLTTHYGLLVNICSRVLKGNPRLAALSGMDANDLAQEVAFKLYQSGNGIAERGASKFLPLVARRELMHSVKAATRSKRTITDSYKRHAAENQSPQGPPEILLRHERAGQLRKAIQALSGPMRTIMEKFYLDEITVGETALETGYSKSSVEKYLVSGRKRLRESLKDYFTSRH
jgi:RNA polymerase sigma factor (sigma-70 family)